MRLTSEYNYYADSNLFWTKCKENVNTKVILALEMSMESTSTAADNLREVLSFIDFDYTRQIDSICVNCTLTHDIRYKWCRSTTASDLAICGAIHELCL